MELAELCRMAGLALSQSEAERLAPQLEALLASVERVRAAPVDDVEPARPAPARREDRPGRSTPRAVLGAAPGVEKDHVVVEE